MIDAGILDGDTVVIRKSDSADSIHHMIPVDDVEKIDDNRIYLKEGTRLPEGLGNKAVMS